MSARSSFFKASSEPTCELDVIDNENFESGIDSENFNKCRRSINWKHWLRETLVEDEEDSGLEEGDSDSEDDEDYFVDEDSYLEEVNVDMTDYHFNIDAEVEWVRHSNSGQQQDHDPIPLPYFDKEMEELKQFNKHAFEWLAKIPAHSWSRSHFSGRAKSDILLNNLCEYFNGKILDARDAPIITALEYIREYLMRRMVNVIAVINKTDGPLTPSINKLLKVAMDKANKYTVGFNEGKSMRSTNVAADTRKRPSDAGNAPANKKQSTTSSNAAQKQKKNGKRCNMRILKSLNPTTNNLNNKVYKTIKVGSSIGYEMRGKEIDVRRIIGDEIVNQ
ncbi:hypothetical protein Tco_0494288 [Tanacetum coccineum]